MMYETQASSAECEQPPLSPEAKRLEQQIILAAEALADTPEYLEQIGGTFARCAERLRGGQQRDGYNDLCQGIADLDQFILLFDHLWRVAEPATTEVSRSFKDGLVDSMRSMEQAINGKNATGLCDEIESRFLPLLPTWGGVAQELISGLRARA